MKRFKTRGRMLCFTGAVLLSLSCGPQGDGDGPVETDGTYGSQEAALTAPTLLEAVPGDGQVTLRWSAGTAVRHITVTGAGRRTVCQRRARARSRT
ncbi:hypothetical protein OV208_30265 [Corallococcus sp. bb12-1]|uniref:hypothetical protein n=1 Tax=Corallococcus sp. bb12-1 TaxID=2996784 RepID=UPI002270E119|nr:hypothetical protein [Corallococcus sp. bb12-1]MCY1045639.1 hypothetical protein [Corallococcus sp. bb12-1]